ncbi:MAG: galactose mutarotase [Clostridiaceae bacterium]|jgi:aldose 1-epimerase|nr:galactose mutarotase [Clostridiaceae bacterium]
MAIVKTPFGTTRDGIPVDRYTLTGTQGMQADVITFGAVLQRLLVPDAAGNTADVTLGFDTLEGYEGIAPFFGAVVGRYGNRVGGSAFELDGVRYQLNANDRKNSLHGGFKGFGSKVWQAEIETRDGIETLVLSYDSPDGEEGYPGNLHAEVAYSLTPDNALMLAYRATTDKPTIVNLTNHAYFNLSGHKAGSIEDHIIRIPAGFFTVTDNESIPTGEIRPVDGTPLDLRDPTRIGEQIDSAYDQIRLCKGYDNNWVLPSDGRTLVLAAEVTDPASGRTMQVLTNHRGVQFYTGNGLRTRLPGKEDAAYASRGGFCLETQFYPDAIHQPHFPSPVLRPGEEHRSTTLFRFGTR